MVWVHSSSKQKNDAATRERQIRVALKNLQTLIEKLNRYKLKTREAIQSAVEVAIKDASKYLNYEIIEHSATELKQVGRGKPNSKTKYVVDTTITYSLSFQRNETAIKSAAATDGVFPLVDNVGEEKNAVEVLKIYKQQPYLEKRHSTLKTVEKVSPIYFKKPERIEAMLFLYFVALMIISLIERNIRRNLSQEFLIEQQTSLGLDLAAKLPPSEKLSKRQEQIQSNFGSGESVSELVKEMEPIVEPPSTISAETFEIIEKPIINSKPVVSVPVAIPSESEIAKLEINSFEAPINSKPVVAVPVTVPSESEVTKLEINSFEAPINSKPVVSVPVAVPVTVPSESEVTKLEVNSFEAPINSKPVVSVPVAVPVTVPSESEVTKLEVNNFEVPINSKPVVSVPVAVLVTVPSESEVTKLEVNSFEAPINSKPVVSVPVMVPSESEVTILSVPTFDTSTNSLPKITSVPIKPQQILPDVSKGLPILPQGMKTNTPTWENIKYVLK
jgi:hypothetical protein